MIRSIVNGRQNDVTMTTGSVGGCADHDVDGEPDLDHVLEDLLAVETLLHRQDVEQLQRALASSRQIGVAIGIIMSRQLLTRDEAFEQLVRSSRNSNRKLRDVAAEVERTSDLLDAGSRRHEQ